MSGFRWVSEAAVRALHDRQLAEHGGPAGVRDAGLLASALARPRNAAAYGETRIAALAALYAHGIASNHPFVDGNKRAAFITCVVFLKLNGYDLRAPETDATRAMMALAAGHMDVDGFAAWTAANIVARERLTDERH